MDTDKEIRLKLAPSLVRQAVLRTRHKRDLGLESEAIGEWSRVWFRCGTEQERAEVDGYLCQIKHPLAFEPGTAEQRFRSIVMELV